MKRHTSKIIMLLLLAVAFTASCKKDQKLPVYNTNHGTISLDYRMCAMCGYLIVFDNDTSTVYRSFQIPRNSGITSGVTFPVKATIGWKPDTTVKIPHFITIISLKIDR